MVIADYHNNSIAKSGGKAPGNNQSGNDEAVASNQSGNDDAVASSDYFMASADYETRGSGQSGRTRRPPGKFVSVAISFNFTCFVFNTIKLNVFSFSSHINLTIFAFNIFKLNVFVQPTSLNLDIFTLNLVDVIQSGQHQIECF